MENKSRQNGSQIQNSLEERLQKIRVLCQENPSPKAVNRVLDKLEKSLCTQVSAERDHLAVQVSIYPLRQPALAPVIEEALAIFADYDLRVVPGAMSSMIFGPSDDLWVSLQEVYTHATVQGDVVMLLTLSNACPEPDIKGT